MTAGQVVFAFEPFQDFIGYETGDWHTGCWYCKCGIGYACRVNNQYCQQGYANKGMMHSGYPECPHGMYTGMSDWWAHCHHDSQWSTPGYRAPCGRTTHTEGDIYGYVTRTRTPTGCHSTAALWEGYYRRA